MDDSPREKLFGLLRAHGPVLYQDPQEGAALLQQLGPAHRRELFALTSALQAGIPAELLGSPRGTPIALVVEQLSRRLSDELGLAEEPALWAVESWAMALDLLPRPALPASEEVEGSAAGAVPPGTAPGRGPEASESILAEATPPAAATPPAPPASRPEPIPLPGSPPAGELSGEARVQLEQWLRQAHVHRLRGQWRQAEALCRRALEVAPDDAMGLELLGDLHAEHGDLKEAVVAYRAALSKQPQKVALEEKLGRLVLLTEEEERARIAREVLAAAPEKPVEKKRRSAVVALTALLVIVALGLVAMLMFLPNLFGSIAVPGDRVRRPGR